MILPFRSVSILFLVLVFGLSIQAAFANPPFTVAGFQFTAPEGWRVVPTTSPMRLAELACPGTDGDAEVTFFSFGAGQGGGVDANVQRWLAQFSESVDQINAERAKREVGKLTYHLIRANGTFLSGMPGQPATPMKDYALMGAIIESPNGDVFIKMTGPKSTVDAGADAFVEMIDKAARGGLITPSA